MPLHQAGAWHAIADKAWHGLAGGQAPPHGLGTNVHYMSVLLAKASPVDSLVDVGI